MHCCESFFKTKLWEQVSRTETFNWITEDVLYFVRIMFPMFTSHFIIINLWIFFLPGEIWNFKYKRLGQCVLDIVISNQSYCMEFKILFQFDYFLIYFSIRYNDLLFISVHMHGYMNHFLLKHWWEPIHQRSLTLFLKLFITLLFTLWMFKT